MKGARALRALGCGSLLFLAFWGLASCVQPFSPRLAQTPPSAFSEREARAFFTKSPFCVQGGAPLLGLLSRQESRIELSACWVSPYFRERRRELIKRHSTHWKQWPSAVPLVAAEAPPSPPQAPFFLLAPFAQGLGLWPSGPFAANAATRQVGLSAAPGADFSLDLNEEWGPGDALQIDLALGVRAGEGVGKSCLASLLGQTAARGLSLVRVDGAERMAKRFVILGLGQDTQYAFGPLFVRVWFARFEANGATWLGDFPEKAKLRVALPKGAGEACLGRLPGQPMLYESQLEFDLAGIRRLAHAY